MKISEIILRSIYQKGGEIHHMQFNQWIGQLISSGHLEIYLKGEEGNREVWIQLTEKGNAILSRK